MCRILEALLVGFITTSIAFFGPIYLASCKTLPAVSLFKAPSWQDTRGDKLSNTVLHDNEPETGNKKSLRCGKMVASFTNNAVMLLHMSETGWSEPVSSNILH